MDEPTFVSIFGSVYENSSWVAEAAWQHRPFASVDVVRETMDSIVQGASHSRRMALIQAHPELAGRRAGPRQLTTESRSEQAQAGLSSLSENLNERLLALNDSYQKKFGFPFIICARLNNVATILQAMEDRLTNSGETEFKIALREISKIAKLRLADIVL
jgi:2-oxo-4-hydroxy-4-carboxy-5-ureidoimidazoline decarboxylase